MAIKDNTPKPLKGIRNPDLYPQQGNDLKSRIDQLYAEAAYGDYGVRKGNIGLDIFTNPNLYEQLHYDINNPMFEYGSSRYDNPSMINATPADVLDARASNQSGLAQLGAGTAKMLGLAVTTTVDGTIGLLNGLGLGIYNLTDDDPNTGFWNGMWNNATTNAMADINDAMEKALPNYMSLWEQEAPFWERMFSALGAANFWGNDILKNAGFTMGAAASIYLTGGVAGVLGKALKLGSLGSKIGLATKAIDAAGNISYDLTKAGKYAKWAANTFVSANGEASTEAINSYRENEKDMLHQLDVRKNSLYEEAKLEFQDAVNAGVDVEIARARYIERTQLIEQDSKAYEELTRGLMLDNMNGVYAANMAVLSLSNNLEIGSLIKGGYGNANSLLKNAIKTVDGKAVTSIADIAKGMAKGTLKFEAPKIEHGISKVAGRSLLTATQEGFVEEGTQNLVSSAALIQTLALMNKWLKDTKSSLGTLINADVSEDLADYTKALGKAYEENFGYANSPGWTEVAAGFITGLFGFGFIHKNAEGKIRPTWLGGIKESYESIYGESNAIQEQINKMNKALTDGKFAERALHSILKLAAKQLQDKALEDGDVLGYKNAELLTLVADALYARDMGLLDSYLLMYDELGKGIDETDINEIKTLARNQESGTSAIEGLTDDEIKQRYQDKAQSSRKKIEKALEEYDRANDKYGDLFSSELNRRIGVMEITFKNTLQWDTYRRIDEINKEIQELEDKGEKRTVSETELLQLKKKAVSQLEKQASDLLFELNNIRSNVKSLDDLITTEIDRHNKRLLYKEADKAIQAYLNATTMQEIVDTYRLSPEDTRELVLELAIALTTDAETKTKLELFKNYIGDVSAMETLIGERFPLDGENALLNMQLLMVFHSILNDVVSEMLQDESPVLTRENLKERLQDRINEFTKLKEEADSKSEGTIAYDGKVDYSKALELGILKDKEDIIHRLDDNGEEKIEYSDQALEMFLNALESAAFQDMIDHLNHFISLMDKLDDLRKAAKKPKPAPKKKETKTPTVEDDELAGEDEVDEPKEEAKEEPKVSTSNTFGLSKEDLKAINIKLIKLKQGLTYNTYTHKTTGKKRRVKSKKLVDEKVPTSEDFLKSVLKKSEIEKFLDRFEEVNTELEFTKLINELQLLLNSKLVGKESIELLEIVDKAFGHLLNKAVGSKGKTHENGEDEDLKDTETSFNGNLFPGYVKSELKQGKAVKYSKYLQQWLTDLHLDIQWTIDNVLPKLFQREKGKDVKDRTPIHYIHNNSLNAIFLGVKVEDLNGLADRKDLAIIKTQEGEFALIGTLGYSDYRPSTEPMFNSLLDEIKNTRDDSEWFSLPDKTNRLKDITEGSIITGEVLNLSTLLLPNRNSLGLTIDSLKWVIIEDVENKRIKVDTDNETTYDVNNPLNGLVFVYIPTGNNSYIPAYIETTFFNELYEEGMPRGSQLVLDILKVLRELVDPSKTDEERLSAKGKLQLLLVFSKANAIHVNDDSSKYYNAGTVNAVIDGKVELIFDFSKDTNLEENLERMEEFLLRLNPRINITAKVLESNPKYYLDAGVLRTNVQLLSTIGKDIFLYPIDEDNNYVENKPKTKLEPSLPNSNRQIRFYFNGNYYYKDGDSFRNGKTGESIEDTDGTLAIIYDIKQGKAKPVEYANGTYYIVGDNVYVDNGHGSLNSVDNTLAKKVKDTNKRASKKEERKETNKKEAKEIKKKQSSAFAEDDEEGGTAKKKKWNMAISGREGGKPSSKSSSLKEQPTLLTLSEEKVKEVTPSSSLEVLLTLLLKQGKSSSTFNNGTNLGATKSAKDLQNSENNSTFVAILSKRDNKQAKKQLIEAVKEKFGVEVNTVAELVEELGKHVDLSTNDINSVLSLLKCK